MPKMPSMSSKELVRLLEKGGAVFVRQGSTAPSNPAISLDNITETASQVITVTISVSDDTGITGYYLSESGTAPTAVSDGWVSIQTTTSYNSNVSFTLSSGNGNKTIYVWFMDGAGNISQSSSAAITLNQTDTTAPSSPSVSINNGDTLTTSTAVTLTLSATDNVGVTAYYVSENSAVPSANASGWKSVTPSVSYSAVVPFTLSSGSIGSSIKTVYVWFRDSAGNISASTSDSITLTISDSTAPSSPSVLINNGDTSTTSTAVTLTISATDNVGVTGYCAKESSTTPSSNDTCWTSVTSTTSYSATVSFTLSSSSGTKTVYVWFKDAAGNISASSSDSITYSPSSTWTMLKLPDTGQTTSYTTTYGEDHDYTINPPFYTDNGNGTITDNVTGLIWQKEDDNTTRTWSDAGTYCDELTLGGQSDWRLPSKKELISIVNYGTYSPAINTTYFPNTNSSVYWSSTTIAYNSSGAWIVLFNDGYVVIDYKSSSYYVRCVR